MNPNPSVNIPPLQALSHRLGADAADEWSLVLRHFMLDEGFSFLVLLVPAPQVATLCARSLEEQLHTEKKSLQRWVFNTPEQLQEFAGELVGQHPDPSVGALWLEAVVAHSHPDKPAWERAWTELANRLNERREVLRHHLAIPLLFVGAPWVKVVLREHAPDLWSIRSLVTELTPGPEQQARSFELLRPFYAEALKRSEAPVMEESVALDDAPPLEEVGSAAAPAGPAQTSKAASELRSVAHAAPPPQTLPARVALSPSLALSTPGPAAVAMRKGSAERGAGLDPEYALTRAARLKEKPDHALAQARLLVRAAEEFLEKNALDEADKAANGALKQLEGVEAPARDRATVSKVLGEIAYRRKALEAAEWWFAQCLEQLKAAEAPPEELGTVAFWLARVAESRRLFPEAERWYRQSLAWQEAGEAPAELKGATAVSVAMAVAEQGRFKEAETLARQAVTQFEPKSGLGTAYTLLGVFICAQGRIQEAEQIWRQTLEAHRHLLSPGEQARLSMFVGSVVRTQGRTEEAEQLFAQAKAVDPNRPPIRWPGASPLTSPAPEETAPPAPSPEHPPTASEPPSALDLAVANVLRQAAAAHPPPTSAGESPDRPGSAQTETPPASDPPG